MINFIDRRGLKMKFSLTKKIAITAILISAGVVGSMLSIPVFGAKCAPIQHIINVISAVLLGPWYALISAFITSLLRNMLGIGSLLAFPGSMCGAFMSGMLYQCTKKLPFAYIGEIFGTGIIGALLAYPLALLIMGNAQAAIFIFVVPFMISSLVGTITAIILFSALNKTKILNKIKLK